MSLSHLKNKLFSLPYRLTKFGFWIALGAAVFVGVQVQEMATQTQILSSQAITSVADSVSSDSIGQKQIEALQDEVTAIQRSMRQDQRAWISYEVATLDMPNGVPPVGSPFLIRISFKNIGKSAALKTRTCTVGAFLPKDRLPTFECTGQFIQSGTLFPGSSTFSDLVGATHIQQTDRDKIMSDTFNMWVYGRFEYTDVFHVQHWLNFCNRLLSGGGYAVCDKHTEVDENY